MADYRPSPEVRNGFEIERPRIRCNASGATDAKGAAQYLGVTERTLRSWRALGQGPRYRTVVGRYWYHLDELDRFLAEGEQQPGLG